MAKKILIQEDLPLNAESTITVLRSLEAAYPEKSKIHVFCDNARYYKNKEVMAHLTRSKKEFYFITRAWAWARARARKPILQFNCV